MTERSTPPLHARITVTREVPVNEFETEDRNTHFFARVGIEDGLDPEQRLHALQEMQHIMEEIIAARNPEAKSVHSMYFFPEEHMEDT